jgi:non-specific serine/threonine protein kinase
MTSPQPAVRGGQIPAAATSFVGRRRELAEIRDRFSSSRLVTLVGPGGVGKTRLALQATREMSRNFSDDAQLVELASVIQDEAIPNAVVHALGIVDQSYRDPTTKIVDHLYDREMLLVLDNCEHVLGGCVRLVDRILRTAPNVRILATSRTALSMTEEARYPVPQLTVPDTGGEPREALEQYESIRLFLDRASAAVPGFALSRDNAALVAALCVQLEGIPLAIELAVARLRTLSLNQLVERLSDRFGLLTSGSRAAEPRQQTLRALIDWSYALCTPDERRFWAQLSVFAGGFDLAAAEGVCGRDAPAAVLDLLTSLVDQSVVYVEHDGSEVRFRMLETIREYGAERLAYMGESDALSLRHRRYFLDLARNVAATWCGPGQEASARRLRTERDNLRAVMDGCARDGAHEDAIELVGALRYRWYADGYIAQGRRWADEALDRPGTTARPTSARATALWSAAWVCLLQGEPRVAERRIDECERLAAELDDTVAQAYVAKLRGLAAMFGGDLEASHEHYDLALGRLRAVGEFSGLLAASFQHTLGLSLDGRHDDAQRVSGEALALSEQRGERWTRSYIQWTRGLDCWLRGEYQEADRLGREALALHRVFNQSVGTALMTELLAWVSRSMGDDQRSAQLLGGVGSLWTRAGTGIAAFGPQLLGLHTACEDGLRRSGVVRTAMQAGAAGTTAQTIAYALGELPDEDSPSNPDPAATLTRRQLEIADLIAEGLSNREIAARLVLSVRTAESHVDHIMTRLGFTSRTQIASWAAGRNRPSS